MLGGARCGVSLLFRRAAISRARGASVVSAAGEPRAHEAGVSQKSQGAVQGWPHERPPAGSWAGSLIPSAAMSTKAHVNSDGQYVVQVVTGTLRGAGTDAPATVKLIGEDGSSDPFTVGDDEEDVGFPTGTTRSFQVDTGRDLGQLRRLQVKQLDPGIGSTGTGWFVDKVMVSNVVSGEEWAFPVKGWFGESDCGGQSGPLVRDIEPGSDASEVPSTESVPLRCHTSAATVPHPKKLRNGTKAVIQAEDGYGGEDAYFVLTLAEGDGRRLGLGVADGVYMWSKIGIDAGLFSRALMASSKELFKSGLSDLSEVMHAAYNTVTGQGVQGSCTICLVQVDLDKGLLTSANIGDSGFIVLGIQHDEEGGARRYVKFRSPHQEHDFGRPFQLGHHEHSDSPDDAMVAKVYLEPGDAIVAGSDGLFDNVADAEIVEAVEAFMHGQVAQGKALKYASKGVARHLVALAYEYSLEKFRPTPYSTAATEAFNMVYNGGKKDDITCLVAMMDEL